MNASEERIHTVTGTVEWNESSEVKVSGTPPMYSFPGTSGHPASGPCAPQLFHNTKCGASRVPTADETSDRRFESCPWTARLRCCHRAESAFQRVASLTAAR